MITRSAGGPALKTATLKKHPKQAIKVKDFLRQMIEIQVDQGKSQRDIAVEIGYEAGQSNIISMFKQGVTRLPINKIGPMAKALGVDPIYMMRLVLNEYSPDMMEAFENILSNRMVSANEMTALDVIRSAAGGADVGPETDEEVAELAKIAAKWKK